MITKANEKQGSSLHFRYLSVNSAVFSDPLLTVFCCKEFAFYFVTKDGAL